MRRVLVRARGVVCTFGAGEGALWSGLERGGAPFGADQLAARVPDAALARALPLVAGADRSLALAAEAALQLRDDRAFADVAAAPARLGVSVGTTQGAIATWTAHQAQLADDARHRPPRPSLHEPALEVARLLGARGPVHDPSMACASGAAALGLSTSWLRERVVDAAVAGGADALSELVATGFGALRAIDPQQPRPFDRARGGLGLGEGAALVLLAACDGPPPPGAIELAGWGLSSDAHHLTGPDPTGAGLARAISTALADAGVAPEEIGFISAHGTATAYNDLMEAKAFALALGETVARRVPVNSIKGALGHTMAAAGAIEAVLCAQVLERRVVPVTAGLRAIDPEIPLDVVHGAARAVPDLRVALSTSSGFGGVNAALVLRRCS
jgi:3-oxoacyl-[acyl-carrier-protein] synthase II